VGRFRTERDSDYFKVLDDAINAYTWAAVVKLQERKVVEEVLGPVGQGKEAKLVLARRGDGTYAVLKIFYPVPVRFVKSRYSYLLGDPRFRGLKISDQLHLVETWCRKEFGNLSRAYSAGVAREALRLLPQRARNAVHRRRQKSRPLLAEVGLKA